MHGEVLIKQHIKHVIGLLTTVSVDKSSVGENFFTHKRGKNSKHYISRVLYIPFYLPKSPIILSEW